MSSRPSTIRSVFLIFPTSFRFESDPAIIPMDKPALFRTPVTLTRRPLPPISAVFPFYVVGVPHRSRPRLDTCVRRNCSSFLRALLIPQAVADVAFLDHSTETPAPQTFGSKPPPKCFSGALCVLCSVLLGRRGFFLMIRLGQPSPCDQ